MKRIKNYFYHLALKLIANRIINGDQLTESFLVQRGWIREYDKLTDKTFYVEPHIKDRDKVSIEFENHYYRVFHGKERAFIGLESSVQWLQLHLLLLNKYGK